MTIEPIPKQYISIDEKSANRPRPHKIMELQRCLLAPEKRSRSHFFLFLVLSLTMFNEEK